MKQHSEAARPTASAGNVQSIYSLPTLKNIGNPAFRSRIARDYACILDLDDNVINWSTKAAFGMLDGDDHRADFLVNQSDGTTWLVDAPDRISLSRRKVLDSLAKQRGVLYRVAERWEIYSGARLQNARDLLRYANSLPTLAERLRLLTVLDDQGSLRVSDCLQVVQGRDPVAVIAAMILNRFIYVDLDEALIGPETMVRRIRS